MVAADAQAGPHVMAALDGVKRDGGAVLTARINVRVDLASFRVLRSRRTPVFFHPEGNGAGDGIVFTL